MKPTDEFLETAVVHNAREDDALPTDRKAALGQALCQRILRMEMAPGAVVDEVALAEEFGLSRPPVRELMRQMAAEGYIVLEANRPARVAPMDYQHMRSFFLAAPLIYVATTQLAASNAMPQEVERLWQIQTRFREAIETGDVQGRVLCNDQFHCEIGHMARNPYLLPSLRRLLLDHARLGKTFYRLPATDDTQQDMQAAVRQHDEMIEAIARGDAQAAGDVVRAHWELSRRRMADYVVPQGMAVPLQF